MFFWSETEGIVGTLLVPSDSGLSSASIVTFKVAFLGYLLALVVLFSTLSFALVSRFLGLASADDFFSSALDESFLTGAFFG